MWVGGEAARPGVPFAVPLLISHQKPIRSFVLACAPCRGRIQTILQTNDGENCNAMGRDGSVRLSRAFGFFVFVLVLRSLRPPPGFLCSAFIYLIRQFLAPAFCVRGTCVCVACISVRGWGRSRPLDQLHIMSPPRPSEKIPMMRRSFVVSSLSEHACCIIYLCPCRTRGAN